MDLYGDSLGPWVCHQIIDLVGPGSPKRVVKKKNKTQAHFFQCLGSGHNHLLDPIYAVIIATQYVSICQEQGGPQHHSGASKTVRQDEYLIGL